MEFHKDVLKNIKEAQNFEWLETNALGSYASSSIAGMNMRREHGLLVVPHSSATRKVVTLAKFEETVFVENKLYEISTNYYKDSIYPHGYQYLEKFSLNPFPNFYYQIEDRRIRKVVLLLEHQNVLLVRYELMNQGRPVTLVIKPFIAVRFNDTLNTEVQGLNTDTYLGEGFVRWAPRPAMPELYIYFDKGEFITATLWYHNFMYPRDLERYGKSDEDLFNPGFFQLELKPYEKLDLFIAPHALDKFRLDFEEQYYQESKRRKQRFFQYEGFNAHVDSFGTSFQRAVRFREDKVEFDLSYFSRGKNTFYFLFELSAFIQLSSHLSFVKNTLVDLLKYLDAGLLPVNYPFQQEKPVYSQADLSLWYIYVVYLYYQKTGDIRFIEDKLFERLRAIIDAYLKGTTFNIYTDKDGLIFSGERSINTSWIPLKQSNGDVYRFGKLLEVNALWYNALRIMEKFSKELKKRRLSGKYGQMAEKVRKSFNAKFVNKQKVSFFDFVNLEESNGDLRINQIVPLFLPFKLIEQEFGQKILQKIEEELLTPYGLRSQSVFDVKARKLIPMVRKPVEFYCGAIWPWSVVLYVKALIDYEPQKEIDQVWLNYFKPLFDLGKEAVMGYLPEAIYLNDRLKTLGIEDFTPALASVLWADFLIEQHVEKQE